jgi:glycosyltransferase involved in cell wall biosynthesis
MKKVAIIGTVGVPGRYGGFETLAHQLVNKLGHKFELKVYCTKHAYSKEERPKYFQGARLYYLPFRANGIQSVLYDMVSIIHALFVADTLIILGVSGGLIVPFVRIFTNKKIIVNIDGLEWRRAKWGKVAKAFLKLSERLAVRWSHADITDNEAIKRYTSVHYETLSQLIEYGGDQVMKIGPSKTDSDRYPFIYKPYAFKVARIEPENNIDLILEAFAGDAQLLVLVGNWNTSEYGRALREKYGQFENLLLLDPIYEQRALDVLRSNCYFYLHGHGAGGTNPSLVEAMSLDLPIVAFDCSFNRATTENRAIYFKSVAELRQVYESTPFEDFLAMRSVMREIAQRRYTWSKIAEKYTSLILAIDAQKSKNSIWSEVSKLDIEVLRNNGMVHLKDPLLYYEKR